MAVLPLNPSISAQVLIGDKPATEFPDFDDIEIEHDDPEIVEYQRARTVSTYIECEADAVFSLKLTAGLPDAHANMKYPHFGFHVTIDGNKVADLKCSRTWFAHNDRMVEWTRELRMVKAQPGGKGKTIGMEFRFARIAVDSSSTTSAAKIKRYKQRMEKVGLIEITIYREGRGKKGGPLDTSAEKFLKPQDTKNVPEKALKGRQAKSDCTLLGKEKKAYKGDEHFTNAPKRDGEDRPVGIFRFMYRSREALRALHVIQHIPEPDSRDSSPEPSMSREQTPDPDHIPDEEGLTPYLRRKLAEKNKAIAEKLKIEEEKLKAEAMAEALAAAKSQKRKTTEDVVKVKKEKVDEQSHVFKRARKSTDTPAEVVSLISDDEDEAPSVQAKAQRAEKVAPSVEEEAPRVVEEEEDTLFVRQ